MSALAAAPRSRPTAARRTARAVGAALLLAAVAFEGVTYGAYAPVLLGLVGPDLALLAGAGGGLARGQLHPRAVPLYNALHGYWLPVGAMFAAIPDPMPKALFIFGLAWTAHVALDRALGYGLRTREGFQRER